MPLALGFLIVANLVATAARHPDVLGDPPSEVEFVEAGPAALRFQLQVWSLKHLKTAGTLKSDLNFEVWRQLTLAGVTIREPTSSPMLGLHLVTPPKQ